MSLFNRMGFAYDVFKRTGQIQKTLSGSQWKKGFDLRLGDSSKGVRNPMQDSALVYAAIRALSETLPQAKLKFWRNGSELPITDPLVRLFNKPSADVNQFMFLEESTMFLVLFGQVFWKKVESKGQRAGTRNLPAELNILRPQYMEPVTDPNTNELKEWKYGRNHIYKPDELIQIKFPNPYNFHTGFSPLDSVKSDIDADYLAARLVTRFFINGAAPGHIITRSDDDESTPEKDKEFIRKWNALFQGVDESNKTAIMNVGMDIKKIGSNFEEMDFVNIRQFITERVLSALGVPPPVVGYFDRATYSNAKTAMRHFWIRTVKSYARRYESMIYSFLVDDYDPNITPKFDYTEIDELKKDIKEIADIVRILAEQGVPINYLLDAYDLGVHDAPGLDTGYIQISRIPVGTQNELVGKVAKEMASKIIDAQYRKGGDSKVIEIKEVKQIENTIKTKELQKKFKDNFDNSRIISERLFYKSLDNYLFTQGTKVLNKLLGKKDAGPIEVAAILNRIDIRSAEDLRLEAKFQPVYTKLSEDAAEMALVNLGMDVEFVVDQSIIARRVSILKSINNTTWRTVESVVRKGVEKGTALHTLGKEIRTLYKHIRKTRAVVIARTETGGTMNEVALNTYKEKGVTKKEWVGGTRETHAAVSGTVIYVNEDFHVGQYFMKHPGDPSAGPEEIVNCTCSISPVIE